MRRTTRNIGQRLSTYTARGIEPSHGSRAFDRPDAVAYATRHAIVAWRLNRAACGFWFHPLRIDQEETNK